MQVFNGINTITTFTTDLVHDSSVILKIGKEDKRGILYKIRCKSCDSVYVGQTPRALKTRVKEHAKVIATLDQFFVGQTPCAPQP